MTEKDPTELAETRQREADQLQQRSEQLEGQIKETRQDWHRKRADESIAGAPPLNQHMSEDEPEDGAVGSPAPEAPPPEEGPSRADAASEGAAGPPSDTGDE